MNTVSRLILTILLLATISSAWRWQQEIRLRDRLRGLNQPEIDPEVSPSAPEPAARGTPSAIAATGEAERLAVQVAAVDRVEGDVDRLTREIAELQTNLSAHSDHAAVMSENRTLWDRYRALANQPEIFAAKKEVEDKVLRILSEGVKSFLQQNGKLPEGMTGVTETVAPEDHVFFHINFDHDKFEIVERSGSAPVKNPGEVVWIRSKPLNDFDEIISVYADGRVEVTQPRP